MKTLMVLFLLIAFCSIPSCERDSHPVAFEFESGNETQGPQFLHLRIIKGDINNDNIAIHYRIADKNGNADHDLVLVGEKFRKCLDIVRNTTLHPIKPIKGAPTIEVALIDNDGVRTFGDPSNAGEWNKFADEIQQEVNRKK